MKRKPEKSPVPIPVNDDFYEVRYHTPTSKRLKSFQMVEQYILQQRKRNIVIYTNDAQMKGLFEKAYPNVIVKVLDTNDFAGGLKV